jgi:hypothetical protein
VRCTLGGNVLVGRGSSSCGSNGNPRRRSKLHARGGKHDDVFIGGAVKAVHESPQHGQGTAATCMQWLSNGGRRAAEVGAARPMGAWRVAQGERAGKAVVEV